MARKTVTRTRHPDPLFGDYIFLDEARIGMTGDINLFEITLVAVPFKLFYNQFHVHRSAVNPFGL